MRKSVFLQPFVFVLSLTKEELAIARETLRIVSEKQ